MLLTRLGLALALAMLGAPVLAAAPSVDPKCFEGVGWEVDPASEAIQVWGCRPTSEIPAPDAQGWIEYDRGLVNGSDGGFIRARLVSATPDGTLVFDVQDNGGGSGTFPFRVTGRPGPDGVLARAGLKVDALPAG
jgi:hypothetical protein